MPGAVSYFTVVPSPLKLLSLCYHNLSRQPRLVFPYIVLKYHVIPLGELAMLRSYYHYECPILFAVAAEFGLDRAISVPEKENCDSHTTSVYFYQVATTCEQLVRQEVSAECVPF